MGALTGRVAYRAQMILNSVLQSKALNGDTVSSTVGQYIAMDDCHAEGGLRESVASIYVPGVNPNPRSAFSDTVILFCVSAKWDEHVGAENYAVFEVDRSDYADKLGRYETLGERMFQHFYTCDMPDNAVWHTNLETAVEDIKRRFMSGCGYAAYRERGSRTPLGYEMFEPFYTDMCASVGDVSDVYGVRFYDDEIYFVLRDGRCIGTWVSYTEDSFRSDCTGFITGQVMRYPTVRAITMTMFDTAEMIHRPTYSDIAGHLAAIAAA